MDRLMLKSVFLKTIRDRRKALFWWSVGTILYLLLIGAVYPSIMEMGEQLDLLMAAYPAEILAMFGGDQTALSSPAGFLQVEGFGWLVPLVFAFFAAGMGARAIAGEEEENTMDLLLATPISRSSIVIEKACAMLVCLVCLGIALIVGLVFGYFFQMKISFGNILSASSSAVLIGLVFGTVALAVSAATGRRGVSMAVMSALAIGSYLLYSLGALVDGLKDWKWLSPFFYYAENEPLANGIDWSHASVLLGVSVIGVIAAVFAFRRRDISVGS